MIPNESPAAPAPLEAQRIIYEQFKRSGCFDPAKEVDELLEDLRSAGFVVSPQPPVPVLDLEAAELKAKVAYCNQMPYSESGIPDLIAEIRRLRSTPSEAEGGRDPQPVTKTLEMVLCCFPGELTKRMRHKIADKFAEALQKAEGTAKPSQSPSLDFESWWKSFDAVAAGIDWKPLSNTARVAVKRYAESAWSARTQSPSLTEAGGREWWLLWSKTADRGSCFPTKQEADDAVKWQTTIFNREAEAIHVREVRPTPQEGGAT